jgi:SAM-dependent methyltransferase
MSDSECSLLDRLVGLPPVLDACCGGRMMWFDKDHPLALFQDERCETVEWEGFETIPGTDDKRHRKRQLEIRPDVVADFREMPYADNSFHLVAFDPPHFSTLSENARTAKLYGRLFGDWESDLAAGFRECFRVLKPCGTLVFKWNSSDIELPRVLALSPVGPLFGHTTGRQSKTHWVCFMKPNDKAHFCRVSEAKEA